MIFCSRTIETNPEAITTNRWITRNDMIKEIPGQIRQIVIALTASAPPHHFNSQAAQKPMIAKAESGED
jgi:hypothetical protein